MASTKERAWLAAHQKGSKALVAKLDKAHAKNPEYQAFKQKHGLGDTSSVKQVSKSQVDAKKEKARQVLAGKAYGATKGTRMGSAEGTGETLRDTIAPLTRDQHSAVKAAEKAAKDAEKPAKPVKAPKPKKEKAAAPAPEKKKPTALELIAAAAAKRKINAPPVSSKALRRIAAVGDMDHDHGGFEDLEDTSYGGRRSYNEETIVEGGNYGKPYNNDEDLNSKSNKELQSLHDFWKTRIEKNPNHGRAKGQLAKIKAILAGKIGKKTNEEVEQIEEAYNDDRSNTKCEECKKGKYVEKDWYGAHLQCTKCGDVVNRYKSRDNIKEPPPEAMASDTRIKPLPKKGKHTTGSFNKFGNFTPGMKEEVELDENDYSRRRKKEEDIISGKKPARKKIPMGSDYAARRRKERLANNGRMDESRAAETLGYMLGNFNSDHSTRLKYIAIAPTSHLKYLLKNNMGSRVVNRTNDNGQPVTHPMIKHIKKELANRNVQKERVKQIDEMDSEGYRGTSEPHYSSYAGKKWIEAKVITPKQAVKGASKIFKDILKKQSKHVKEEVEQIDEMKMRVGTIVKLKKPIDGHEYARVKGFSSSGHTRGPTGRGVPMPAGKVTKVHVALKKTKDDAYDPGPVTHIQHDDVHSVIGESTGWMLRQDPKLAKKVRDKIKLAKKRQKQMGTKEPIKEARKKYYQGGALFADTAARLQGAINKHKERMNQIENGPEDTYHHAGLNLTTKSRVKLPAPWAKVEEK